MKDAKVISLPDVKRIEEEAAVWIMRLQDGDASKADIAKFQEWRNTSAKHTEIFKELSNYWGGLDFVEDLKDYAQNDAVVPNIRKDKATHRFRQFKRALAVGIAASLIVTVGIGGYQYAFNPDTGFSENYHTAIGEQETIELPDGSKIILNTNSAIEVRFSKQAREIILSNGEAFFDVAPNKERPFSVKTDKGTVTAVGTAFSVRLNGTKLDVLVTEGRVALSSPSITSNSDNPVTDIIIPRILEISAGQSAVLSNGIEQIAMVQPEIIEKKIDWQDGELSFKGETLDYVVDRISRYTDLTIVVEGDALRNQRIVAFYKVGDIDRWFEALNVMANIEVEYIDSDHVRLYRSQE